MSGAEPKTAALLLLTYAEVASLPRSREAARDCNAALSRTRDFLVHAPAMDLAVRGAPIPAAAFDALRNAALREMRARCATCGRCAVWGLTPP